MAAASSTGGAGGSASPISGELVAAAAARQHGTPLAGKVAVITGGGSGIGLATAHLFAQRGAKTYVLDLNMEAAAAAADSINADEAAVAGGGSAVAVECDVTKAESVNAAFNRVASENDGTLDCLVNNAGIGSVGTVLETTAEDMAKLTAVNINGVFHCLQAGVRIMKEKGNGGAIINMGSICSLIGLADRFSYSMTKGAVLTMTYSVATDYVKDNIRCNCVCPARVHTPFVDSYLKKNYPGQEEEMFKKLSAYQPIGRMAKPSEIAAMIAFLATDEASFVTGSAFSIDGGVTCVM